MKKNQKKVRILYLSRFFFGRKEIDFFVRIDIKSRDINNNLKNTLIKLKNAN